MKTIGSLSLILVASLLSTVLESNAETRPAPYHEIKKISLEGGDGWDLLTFDSESRRLYVTRASHVEVVNIDEGKVVGEIPNTQGVHGVALAPALKRGFATNGKDGTVLVFDTVSLKEQKRIPVGTKPDAIIYEPTTGTVFVFNGGSDDLTVIDAKSLDVLKTIPLPGKPEIPATDNAGTVFVNIEDKSEMVAIDAHSFSIKATWPLAPCEEPTGLSIDRESRRLFAVCSNKTMVVVNAASGKVVASVSIGEGPDGSAFDEKRKLAFSTNGKDGTLTVIHEITPDKYEVVANVPTQKGARTLALDPKTGNVLSAAAKDISPSPDVRPRTYEPGTFSVLVIGQ